MNRKQRIKNKQNAQRLAAVAKAHAAAQYTCENCGEKGGHWVAFPMSVEDIMLGRSSDGFWSCVPGRDKGLP